MTLKEKLGQLFIIGIEGTELSKNEQEFIVSQNIGGIILMGRNCKSPEQIHKLCSEIQLLRHKTHFKTPLFCSIDMEGGRVARLKSPFTQWPPLKKLGDIDSPSLAFNMAMLMGRELRAVGINLDFAPCVDVLTNKNNKAIGDRSLSDDPEVVARLASALVRGFMKSEVMTCAKHFPGHGNTIVDSHDELPIEEANIDRLTQVELIPFKKAIRSRVDFIMMSHVLFKNIDANYPSSLSQIMIQKILREELRFRGLIITDDLDMKAMTKTVAPEEIPVRAFEAGCDVLLYCNDPSIPPKAIAALEKAVAIGRISLSRVEESYQRVQKVKRESILTIDPLPWSEVKETIGNVEHQKIAEAIEQGKVPEGLAQGA